ncbi:TIR domain-containing protein [Vibrio vulnificus]|uniref:TIR domain-containing protein n=1 Tax=Vibrio vulnificus TaxID=672 RepID=UPI000F4E1A67|nr:TIR domain-containing protein [Vibrio vulnificus]EJU9788375.1 toll/interleukin-1 receptor domain-containing protein [Vibrio vulnificus]ELV8644671.1 toll/interleukin-1 receptor domain-containing protein [Vibrio vulnificus]MCA3988524.1 toll/interleukin-1 receptor domain-containing protein [Vibrio vulnificus]MCA3992904.1 toll/interleukin-1 receptor domain-containing protein [Vibrio vulnificus]RPB30027.1 toll-Interleukin receptor [Vibrio vulnificus]
MKIFISWSGDRSRQVAELLDEWITCVIQAVKPWMSSKDIDRGSLWFSEISDQLQNTSIGIVCLTQENKVKPWILFESGALAKGLSSNRVCTFLIDLSPADIENPLAQFNHSTPDKVGLWELVRTINNALGEHALKEKTLENVFETYWPQFNDEFNRILEDTPSTEVIEKRSEDDLLKEILANTRNLERRIRHVESPSISTRRRGNRHSVDPDIAKVVVEHLYNKNTDKEMIVSMVEGLGAPAGWVENQLSDLDEHAIENS